MRRSSVSSALLTTLVALALYSAPASAAGFDLRWDACAADGGTSNKNFACDTDFGNQKMVASFKLDQPITGLYFVEAVLDIIVAGSQPVPPWWEIFDCRYNGLVGDPTHDPSWVNCDDWSGGIGGGGLIGFSHDGTIAPADTASHRRIIVAVGANPPGVNLVANQEYFLFNLRVDNDLTTGPGSCAGCAQPVCIVLNSLRFTDLSFNVLTLGAAQVAGGNFATWQGGAGANCSAVLAKKATWAAVKSLYR